MFGIAKYFCLPLVSNEGVQVVRKMVITLTVSLRIAISRDKWSFSTWRASMCALTCNQLNKLVDIYVYC